MRVYFILFLLSIVASCDNPSAVGKQFAGCDSLEINFNNPGTNNIAKTVSTTEVKAIKKLIGFVDNKPVEAYKCGYDGNLMFYKAGKLLGDVAFNYSGDGCRHFIQNNKDSLISTAMSDEAVDFLISLAEGKNWY